MSLDGLTDHAAFGLLKEQDGAAWRFFYGFGPKCKDEVAEVLQDVIEKVEDVAEKGLVG